MKLPIITGTLLFISQLLITLISFSFTYQHNLVDRPILLFLCIEGFAFIVYSVYLYSIEKKPHNPDASKKNIYWILFISLIIRIVLLPSQLIQETDPYRYIWDGQQLSQGINPYLQSPDDRYIDTALSYEEEAPIHDVYIKINYPSFKTIYPPVAQWVFALSQKMSPWNLWGWKIVILLVEMIVILFMVAILKELGFRREWVALYGWSPLILKEFSNSLHLDILAVCFMTITIYFMLRGNGVRTFIFLALAAMVKWYAILLLPILVLWNFNTRGKSLVWGILSFTGILAVSFWPFLDAGSGLFESLGSFAKNWRVNDSLFSMVYGAFQMLPLSDRLLNLVARTTVLGVLGGIVAFSLYRLRNQREVIRYLKYSYLIIASLFFLAPTGNPWYFTWVFPFLIIFKNKSMILFSGLVLLYYLDFYFMYRGNPDQFAWVRFVEYGLFYCALIVEIWKTKKQSVSS